MGQQQLLLLVLGAIIVGLAIVVGINLFGQGAVKANEDAVRQDVLTMMARIEEYYRKPTMLGGAGKTADSLAALTFPKIGYKFDMNGNSVTETYTNENGIFDLNGTATTADITAKLKEDTTLTVKYELSFDTNGKTVIAPVAN
ncbi:hypothetical protein GF406_23800 [candidate division KSB1 bacterium]|nr:hypothetical protein [candidate division KSB1 bacterium]